ncbi:hypothetical protein B7P43_G17892 [Cryptotermes secundus]|uniref:Uncharacterized protein n=1 Tax=Cryptotermes secundus TaxID=105785 RepID=A0A2J7QR29_9NEOP|nr:hypothetical protein B7P43_G17892 [Cryptotermes secundus]
MIKHLPAEHPQETCCPSTHVRPSFIVQEDNTGTKHSAPLVLNGPPQFLQCFTVTLSIHSHPWSGSRRVPEYRAHHFPRRQRLLEFRLIGRSTDANALTAAWFLG